ncbi:YqgE/AlgH family protein [Deminuibacter soli]|uniref:YqgE/AlgH family protein n=1 Tax=Deminuibacter soli TaxID=2291815 RepID=A0A3E1NE01_9BACT|nr:YqgE/AlgH family protein [Deminuibacter soli]RFM26008.1 YqgE/AlgH family protein [Deminuibacter soli]
MKQGSFIKSTPLLNDTVFENTVLFITEYNDKGAMGFIINQQFPRKLNELEAFKHITPFPLYLGGPVDQEHLYFIHQRPDLITGGTPITSSIFFGGDFQSAIKHIHNNTLTQKDIKIFIGYCGWDNLELDEEIAEGSWVVLNIEDNPNNAFL